MRNTDCHQFLPGLPHSDISTARTGTYVSVAQAREITGLLTVASVASGTLLTVTLLQATDANGTGAKTLKAGTKTTTATAAACATVSCSTDELDVANGYGYVAVRVLSGAAAAGAGTIVLGALRYEPQS